MGKKHDLDLDGKLDPQDIADLFDEIIETANNRDKIDSKRFAALLEDYLSRLMVLTTKTVQQLMKYAEFSGAYEDVAKRWKTLYESERVISDEFRTELAKHRGKKTTREHFALYWAIVGEVKRQLENGMGENWAQATRKVAHDNRQKYETLYGDVKQWKRSHREEIRTFLNDSSNGENT